MGAVKAELLHRSKVQLLDSSIVEMVIWRLPSAVAGSSHSFKYRLYFGRNGDRIVGFDNERGKGDHCHLDGIEHEYVFTCAEALTQDFLSEVRRRLRK